MHINQILFLKDRQRLELKFCLGQWWLRTEYLHFIFSSSDTTVWKNKESRTACCHPEDSPSTPHSLGGHEETDEAGRRVI